VAGAATTGGAPAIPPWTAVGPADAPAIVLVHGTRLTRAQWSVPVRRLSRRYRCVVLDLPGHGTRAREPFTLEAAARCVAEAVEAAVPAGRAVIVGLSLGGYVAIEAAERFPDRVAGLVLAGCSGEPSGSSGWPIRALASILERTPPAILELVNRGFFRLRYRPAIADPIIAAGFWPVGGAQALRSLAGRRYRDRLMRLWTPVLVVNGALDPVFLPRGDDWAASCRRGRHAVIRRAMHLSPLDQPRAFADLVAAFTDETAEPG
jgi:pimeloyl-ACP methyl ester carboxylesterase